MYRRGPVGVALVLCGLVLGGCAPSVPVPLPAPADVDSAAVVRRAVPPEPPAPVVADAKPAPLLPLFKPPPPPPIPAGSQYVCVSGSGSDRRETAIEFTPKVAELCRKHPEMGPCQYERDICRRSGGRVYAEGGTEITLATEAEYDKKVMRVRFKAN